jgi:hypothetical protein
MEGQEFKKIRQKLKLSAAALGHALGWKDQTPTLPERSIVLNLDAQSRVRSDACLRCRTWVGLERQAFSIVEEKEPPAPTSEPCTREQLRAEIMAEMEELGISPFEPPSGVANRSKKTTH